MDAYLILTILGTALVLMVIGLVMILVEAFGESFMWGMAIIFAVFGPSLFLSNKQIAELVGTAVVVAFVAQHWHGSKKGFITYLVGAVVAFPFLADVQGVTRKARQRNRAPVAQNVPPAKIERLAPPQRATYAVLPVESTSPRPIDRLAQQPVSRPAEPPPSDIKAPTIERVYALNSTKEYYPENCKARPEGAYRMARSLAVKQGYTLAAECSR